MRYILLIALLASPATAKVRAEAVQPRAAKIYPDDPLGKMKVQVERLMGMYLVDPPRRHRSERVKIKGGQVRIDMWQPVPRLTDIELKTRAVTWFINGRTQYASGVRGVFSEMPGVNEVLLVFHEVIRPDKKGRRRSKKKDKIKNYLALKLTRKKFERLKMRPIKICIEQNDCSTVFRADFSGARLDTKYTKARRAEDEE